MDYFDGKRLYITGGSSGIGLAAALLLASSGAHVAIFARNLEKNGSCAQQDRGCEGFERSRIL